MNNLNLTTTHTALLIALFKHSQLDYMQLTVTKFVVCGSTAELTRLVSNARSLGILEK